MVCCVRLFYCLFFFYNQETAYELRISDWSSYVCSSDLRCERYRLSCPFDRVDIDRRQDEPIGGITRLFRYLCDRRAPWIDGKAVAIGRPPIIVATRLRRCKDEAAGLDRPRAQQRVPMRLAGRDGEGGGKIGRTHVELQS